MRSRKTEETVVFFSNELFPTATVTVKKTITANPTGFFPNLYFWSLFTDSWRYGKIGERDKGNDTQQMAWVESNPYGHCSEDVSSGYGAPAPPSEPADTQFHSVLTLLESHEANREWQLLESLELLESHGAICKWPLFLEVELLNLLGRDERTAL